MCEAMEAAQHIQQLNAESELKTQCIAELEAKLTESQRQIDELQVNYIELSYVIYVCVCRSCGQRKTDR